MSSSNENLQNKRHSLAHLLAAAVMQLYPDTKRTIGPAVDDGFYFDFEFSKPVSDSDLEKIEAKMREILPTWSTFERHELSAEDAKKEYPGNEYKEELSNEFTQNGEQVTFYKSGDYWDLCKGGHVENMSEIDPGSFKLSRIAGAYWRGNEKNTMLTRIYGLAFDTKAELDAHLAMLEEAKLRDHRKLGQDLDLFVFSETVGKGLPLWTAKGATIRRELERFITDEEIKRGYTHVLTPDIAKLDLYKKSGHYPYYKDSMYAPIQIDDEEFMLRPMTCPHHFELYLSKPHSYKELPIRYAELAKLYRYEQSGELSGLIRVRQFCLADAHIVCNSNEQAKQEVEQALDLIEYVAQIFGLKMGENYWYRLSLGDRSNTEKYYNDPSAWDDAEQKLREVLQKRNAVFIEAEAEAAFYGPKIDIQMKNVLGKDDTAFTVQYDFVMAKRFDLKFKNEQGQDEPVPAIIHRSSIGAIERVFAFLIEYTAGNFPVWLAPTQVTIVPISDDHIEFAEKMVLEAIKSEIPTARIELDTRKESMGKKIREASKQKVPYILIIGDKERDAMSVAVRGRGDQDLGVMSIAEFAQKLKQEIDTKA